jgi:hypothetical protein
METFNLKKLNKTDGNEKNHSEISNKFAALEDLDPVVETIRENIKISAKESLGYFLIKGA